MEDTDAVTPPIPHSPLSQLPVEVRQGVVAAEGERLPQHYGLSHGYASVMYVCTYINNSTTIMDAFREEGICNFL